MLLAYVNAPAVHVPKPYVRTLYAATHEGLDGMVMAVRRLVFTGDQDVAQLAVGYRLVGTVVPGTVDVFAKFMASSTVVLGQDTSAALVTFRRSTLTGPGTAHAGGVVLVPFTNLLTLDVRADGGPADVSVVAWVASNVPFRLDTVEVPS